MAINFFRWLTRTNEQTGPHTVPCVDTCTLAGAATEYQIREMCFWICVDMIANALGRCDFRTFENGEEVNGKEAYLWNVSPNLYQNSTAFLHKLVATLYRDNEVLIVDARTRDNGLDSLVVADSFELEERSIDRMRRYRAVRVDDLTYNKTFLERDVLRLQLHHADITGVMDGLYSAYLRMASAAMKEYVRGNSPHWKVHIDQVSAGDPEFKANFAAVIKDQIKPFFESDGAILPEFDGYTYTDVGTASGRSSTGSQDIRELIEGVFDYTARAFQIPAVLVNGKIEGTADATQRFLSGCLDPLCDQLAEEINRKRYSFDDWARGTKLHVDSSSILHYDLFAQAASIEKLIGSGVYSINDIRKAGGQAPINEEWASRHWLTKNFENMAAAGSQL